MSENSLFADKNLEECLRLHRQEWFDRRYDSRLHKVYKKMYKRKNKPPEDFLDLNIQVVDWMEINHKIDEKIKNAKPVKLTKEHLSKIKTLFICGELNGREFLKAPWPYEDKDAYYHCPEPEEDIIRSLEGIEQCKKIYWLVITGQSLTDLSPIVKLPELKYLSIRNNTGKLDISAVGKCKKLKEVLIENADLVWDDTQWELPNLESFEMKDCNFDKEKLQALKKIQPKILCDRQ